MHQVNATAKFKVKLALSPVRKLTAMITLKFKTPDAWADGVIAAMEVFLPDHAAAEKKASSMAMTMVSHYPDRHELVTAMIDLALEELSHFRAVVKLMHGRGLILQPDEKDPYVNALRGHCRQGSELYLMDRLLVAAIVEARGAERFGMVAAALADPDLKPFYEAITRSEHGHEKLFLQFAEKYFDAACVQARLEELLEAEAAIVRALPVRPMLH